MYYDPALSIVMVTYERTDLTLRTMIGIRENLIYPNDLCQWFVGDDGSSKESCNAVIAEFSKLKMNLVDFSRDRIRLLGQEKTFNCGRTWNRALGMGHRNSDFVLFLENDWELTKPLDIRPYIKMLTERNDVGLVRLGHLAVGSDVRIVGHGGVHYLEYLRTTQYAYSGNPQLRHKRYLEYYGYFSEEKNPGDIELDYDSRFRAGAGGPAIWRPADIPGWGVFGHIGTGKSYA